MQILAHADDDLYFMNPDLAQSVRSGAATVSVYLTAGEADGRNVPSNDPNRADAPVDFERYAAARQNGIRAAYATMVTGDRAAEWTREVLPMGDGFSAELATLCADPGVILIFFNLRMAPGTPPVRILNLWNGSIDSQPTLCPTGSPLGGTYSLTRERLLSALGDLLARFAPSVVRVMDLDPDHTAYSADRGAEYCDNADHTAAAMFAMEAVRRYDDAGHDQPCVVESYRGYWNKLWPHNLSGTAFVEKMDLITIYGGADPHPCADRSLCGDLVLGDRAYNRGYGQSTTYRFPGTTNWLQLGDDGRLYAFAVLDGRPVVWTEVEPASNEWSAPVVLGDGLFAPQLHVVRTARDGLRLFGMRITLSSSPYEHRRDVVTAAQKGSDGPFDAWENLGNPYNKPGLNPIKRREMGMPVVAFNADGMMRLFVRNFGTGLNCLPQDKAGWGSWQDLRGTCQDSVATVTTDSGRIEVFGATRTGILRWYQPRPNAAFERDYSLPFPAPAGPPTVVKLPDGRLLMVVRQPSTGWALMYRQTEPDGRWDPQPQMAGGHGGFGLVSATVLGDGTVALAQRNGAGSVGVSFQSTTGAGGSTEWLETGPMFAHSPSGAIDASGRLVVAVLGLDGKLHSARFDQGGQPSGWCSSP
ncbi:PIG-L family deacetylase [Planosporangium sp. 12N6]|uniref:PIG-L family deacetylase n=1 Tax=Planosporangium spinosum TaxID=3402278 RepID=UPI003CF8B55C